MTMQILTPERARRAKVAKAWRRHQAATWRVVTEFPPVRLLAGRVPRWYRRVVCELSVGGLVPRARERV